VRIAGAGDLETIARLALVEVQHRSAPPMFAPRQDRPLAGLAAEHRALREAGAVHLLASLDGHDAGLLTIELTSPVPRLCPDGQPCIGPTAALPAARGQGVAFASVYEIPAVLGLLAAALKLPAEGPHGSRSGCYVRGLPVGCQRRRWRVPGRSLTWWRGVRVTGNWVKQPGSG
jgi:hypothetical protein